MPINLYGRIIFTSHALQQMFQRHISRRDVEEVINNHEVIEFHPSELPYPKALLLGTVGTRKLHVVVAIDDSNQTTHVITAYEPSLDKWEPDFKTRK